MIEVVLSVYIDRKDKLSICTTITDETVLKSPGINEILECTITNMRHQISKEVELFYDGENYKPRCRPPLYLP